MIGRILFLSLMLVHPAWADEIRVRSNDICLQLRPVNHVPAADVNLNSATPFIDKVIRVPVELDGLAFLGLEPDYAQGLSVKPDLGVIELYPDGRIDYDGRDISSRVAQACETKTDIEASQSAISISGSRNRDDLIEGQYNE